MSKDLSPIVDGWDFQPDEITVRSIIGEDGKEKIQLRIDLGIMQLEVHGRPDGKEILGAESWFDLHKQRQKEHDAANPDGVPYLLSSEDCAELMREGVQYYHRYISFWHTERYELCARDTQRNLKLLKFVRGHARYDRDKLQFDQWRPYATMMHTRAVTTPLVALRQWDAAISAVDAGIRAVEKFLSDYGQEEQAEKMGELVFLQRWRKEIYSQAGRSPDSSTDETEESDDPVTQIEKQLAEAVENEDYEAAAQLRDELQRLKEPPPPNA